MAEIKQDIKVSEYSVSNIALLETPVLINADTTLYPHTYGNRLIVVPENSASVTLSLEAPRAAGINYSVMYAGANPSGASLVVDGNGTFMKGSIHHNNTNTNLAVGVRPNHSHDTLTIATGAIAYNLNLVSGDNVWYVYGKVIGPSVTTSV